MAGEWLWMRVSKKWVLIQTVKKHEIPCYYPC